MRNLKFELLNVLKKKEHTKTRKKLRINQHKFSLTDWIP